jgi:hypothetical protein
MWLWPATQDRDELSETASGSSATLSGMRSGCPDLADSHPGDVILCARVAASKERCPPPPGSVL